MLYILSVCEVCEVLSVLCDYLNSSFFLICIFLYLFSLSNSWNIDNYNIFLCLYLSNKILLCYMYCFLSNASLARFSHQYKYLYQYVVCCFFFLSLVGSGGFVEVRLVVCAPPHGRRGGCGCRGGHHKAITHRAPKWLAAALSICTRAVPNDYFSND